MTDGAASNSPGGHAGASQPDSDDHLALRAAEGDERAFEAIFNRYHQDLYRFCLTVVRNPQDAQDALQNTMVKVLRALPGETRQIRLKPWLYRIARNEAVELLRRRRGSAELEPELIASDAELTETVAMRERLRRLLDDLAELPERQRAALVMRELAGIGFDEIGAAFDTSDAVARQTVYEARLSLRQMEAGHEMSCKKVMWELSEADGRVARRRDIQAHLRTCSECRAFRDEIAGRREDLAAIAPLPLAVSTGLLQGLLGGGAAGAGAVSGAGAVGASGVTGGVTSVGGAGTTAGASGALTGAVAAGAGKAVATSAVLKAAATVAVVAAGATAAADRGGLVETPLPSSIGGAKSSGPTPGTAPAGGTEAQSDRSAAIDESSGAVDPDRDPRRGGPNAKHVAEGRGAAAAKGPDGAASKGPDPAPGGKGAKGRSQAKGKGRPDSLPAASKHGQRAAAGNPTRGGKSKTAKGNGAGSKGGGKTAKGQPSHDSNASPKAHSASPHDAPAGKVGPDKAQGVPFQPSTSKGAPPSEESAPPSKEAR